MSKRKQVTVPMEKIREQEKYIDGHTISKWRTEENLACIVLRSVVK